MELKRKQFETFISFSFRFVVMNFSRYWIYCPFFLLSFHSPIICSAFIWFLISILVLFLIIRGYVFFSSLGWCAIIKLFHLFEGIWRNSEKFLRCHFLYLLCSPTIADNNEETVDWICTPRNIGGTSSFIPARPQIIQNLQRLLRDVTRWRCTIPTIYQIYTEFHTVGSAHFFLSL